MAQGEIADQARKIRQRMLEDSIEHRRRNSMTLQALQQRAAQRIQQTVGEAKEQAEREKRELTDSPPSGGGQLPADPAAGEINDSSALLSREEELRRQREAVQRSTAIRHAHNTVAPIDDDGDEEAEYYRRKSWLV